MGAMKFLEKVKNDKVLIDIFLKFRGECWDELNNEERIKLFHKVSDRINLFYPEFNTVQFDIVLLDSRFVAQAFDDYIMLNVDSLDNGKQFEILYNFMHERRHIYQNHASDFFIQKGVVHELFDENKFMEIYKNSDVSKLIRGHNYIYYDENRHYEYMIQPMEYDAELFAREFIMMFMDEFLVDEKDKEICRKQFAKIDEISEMLREKDDFIIDFNKIYKLDIEDHYKKNEPIFEEDERIFQEYMDKLKKINKLSVEELLFYTIPCFWNTMCNKDKIVILARFIELSGFDFDIEYDEFTITVNGKRISSNSNYEVLELIFNEMADQEINMILSQNNLDSVDKLEREIILNLSNESNIIKESENPLFYNVQPYMLYKNKYIFDLFQYVDPARYNLFLDNDYMFYDYCVYEKKYDVKSMMKKVEIITGDSFKHFYQNMIIKMKLSKTR